MLLTSICYKKDGGGGRAAKGIIKTDGHPVPAAERRRVYIGTSTPPLYDSIPLRLTAAHMAQMRDKTFPPLWFFRYYTPPHFHVRPSLVTCTSERKIPLVNVNLVSPPTANKDWRGISWGLTTVHIITLSQPILPSVSFSFNDCIGLDLYYLLKSNTLYSIRKRRIKTAGWYRLKPNINELHLDVIVLDPNRLRVISRNWHI